MTRARRLNQDSWREFARRHGLRFYTPSLGGRVTVSGRNGGVDVNIHGSASNGVELVFDNCLPFHVEFVWCDLAFAEWARSPWGRWLHEQMFRPPSVLASPDVRRAVRARWEAPAGPPRSGHAEIDRRYVEQFHAEMQVSTDAARAMSELPPLVQVGATRGAMFVYWPEQELSEPLWRAALDTAATMAGSTATSYR